jgi:hypothetical protein
MWEHVVACHGRATEQVARLKRSKCADMSHPNSRPKIDNRVAQNSNRASFFYVPKSFMNERASDCYAERNALRLNR